MKEKLLVIQPGKFGDIIYISPIISKYSENYNVYLECPKKYHSFLEKHIEYCTPIETPNLLEYQKIIDLSFGVKLGPVHDWWEQNRTKYDSFVTAKYELAKIDLIERQNLKYNRSISSENELYEKLKLNNNEYILTQQQSDGRFFINFDFKDMKTVEFNPVENYTIFDWRTVILNAKEIHCIPSSMSAFIDTIYRAKDIYKVLYQSFREPKGFEFNNAIHTNNWIIK